jgi:hypothetical protein
MCIGCAIERLQLGIGEILLIRDRKDMVAGAPSAAEIVRLD